MSGQETPSNAPEPISTHPDREAGPPPPNRRLRTLWRRFLIVVGIILFGFVMREVLFPFQGQPYLEIGHGDHTHYVPKDRNETVPVSSFPMRPPRPGERITPDGDIVPKQ